jgi:hypothetical protein
MAKLTDQEIRELMSGKEEKEVSRVEFEDGNLRGGFTQLSNSILRDPGLSSNAKVIYALLLSYAWGAESCFPGQDKLVEHMGVDRKTVIRGIQELTEGKLIQVERRGLGKPNVYHILKLRRRYKMLVDRAING